LDNISAERRSANMRAIRSKGMKPEMIVRKLVYSLGYRYRLHVKDLPGKPDLVFVGKKKVIFVHGCFWHQHQSSKCKIVRKPKSNQPYWVPKLDNNRKRDKRNLELLESLGWKCLTVWECETFDMDKLERQLNEFLK
jgi:DNA mismatch endonuclease (patch repair protein)